MKTCLSHIKSKRKAKKCAGRGQVFRPPLDLRPLRRPVAMAAVPLPQPAPSLSHHVSPSRGLAEGDYEFPVPLPPVSGVGCVALPACFTHR